MRKETNSGGGYLVTEKVLFFGHEIDNPPPIWKQIEGIKGLMYNASDIFDNPRACAEMRRRGIHDYLDYKGMVFADSGGFIFYNRGIVMDPKEVADLYRHIRPDVGVTLDYPPSPSMTTSAVETQIKRTLANTKIMKEWLKEQPFSFMPVIHGYSTHTLSWVMKEINQIGSFKFIGIGGLVPLLFGSKKYGLFQIARLVSFVRHKLSDDTWFHVFGAGSILTMHIMFYLDATSTDSAGWRTSGGLGRIMLASGGTAHVPNRDVSRAKISDADLKELRACQCPGCQGRTKEIQDFVHGDGYYRRLTHNAWILQQEANMANKLIKENTYDEYVKKILKRSAGNDDLFERLNKLKTAKVDDPIYAEPKNVAEVF